MAYSPRAYVTSLLARRWYSRAEIDRALTRRGVEADERQAVIEEFTKAGFISDQRFAEEWVHARDKNRPRATWLLTRELQEKGIDQAIISQVLANRVETGESHDSDIQAAEILVRRTAKRLQALPQEVQKRRLWGVLARRGFSPGVVAEAMKSVDL